MLYWITGNKTYATNAITILNAYSGVKSYSLTNAPLQAAWDGDKWPRAAEIIRAANVGWSTADSQAFGAMLTNVIVPEIYNGSPDNGNWELSMIEAMMGIAVFTDNPALFQHAVTFWGERVPAYIYYEPIDGAKPVPPPRGKLDWNGQKVYGAATSGVTQETCRDMGHTQFGLASMVNADETAEIQGVDLYGSQRPRIEAALELQTYYLAGAAIPSDICGGKLARGSNFWYPTFEVGYNEFHNRLGDNLPNTINWITKTVRGLPDYIGAGTDHMIANETLTHGGNAN